MLLYAKNKDSVQYGMGIRNVHKLIPSCMTLTIFSLLMVFFFRLWEFYSDCVITIPNISCLFEYI